jgi:hypothetical protein
MKNIKFWGHEDRIEVKKYPKHVSIVNENSATDSIGIDDHNDVSIIFNG